MGFALTSISAMKAFTRKSTRSVTRAEASGGEPRGGPKGTKAKDGKHQGTGRSSGRC